MYRVQVIVKGLWPKTGSSVLPPLPTSAFR